MADKLLSKCAHPRTAEARAKMSVAHMGNKNALGHHCSEEARAKMSEARKGIPAWNKGVSPSEEVRAKMGLSLKGVPLSAETRAKMSAAAKGKTKMVDYLFIPPEVKHGDSYLYN